MGVLPDHEIISEAIVIPCLSSLKQDGVISYGPSSYGYDVRLGPLFRRVGREITPRSWEPYPPLPVLDPKNFDPELTEEIISHGPFALPPHSFFLAETVEEIRMPDDVLGICLGKSSYARCGLVITCTPLEPGWIGKVTLELVNSTPIPIRVYPGEGIMQIVFIRGESPCTDTYADRKGRYQNQKGLTLPFVSKT